MKVCLDYGHGGRDLGACYGAKREADDVLAIGKIVAKHLRAKGVVVQETRKDDSFVSLASRCHIANKANYDYFISFHRNAYFPEIASGTEVYVHPNGSPKARRLASRLQACLVDFGYRDRGVKKANFYVLRGTRAPALLVEIGFIDNSVDNWRFDRHMEEMAKRLAEEIVGTDPQQS